MSEEEKPIELTLVHLDAAIAYLKKLGGYPPTKLRFEESDAWRMFDGYQDGDTWVGYVPVGTMARLRKLARIGED